MLGWSINLFRIFGIQLAIHVSFLLLLAYFGWQGWGLGGAQRMLWSTLLIVLFFACVILHELGHSLTARRYGVRVPRILLLPIGGMAEFDRIPRRPAEELFITVAGPAVNFFLVLLLAPFVWREVLGLVELREFSMPDLLTQLRIDLLANTVRDRLGRAARHAQTLASILTGAPPLFSLARPID